MITNNAFKINNVKKGINHKFLIILDNPKKTLPTIRITIKYTDIVVDGISTPNDSLSFLVIICDNN